MKTKSQLEEVVRACLNHDAYDIEAIGEWTRNRDSSNDQTSRVRAFQIDLRHALDNPGEVTPSDFERWTGFDHESQEGVQQHLQKVWDMCFGDRNAIQQG